jgi:hypothetical protein
MSYTYPNHSVFGKTLPALLISLLVACSALADTTGRITGSVKDASGSPIAAVQVTVRNKTMGIQTKAMTDKNGNYSFPSLVVGEYAIHAEAKGYKPYDRTSLTIHVNSAVKIDIVLEVAEKAQAGLCSVLVACSPAGVIVSTDSGIRKGSDPEEIHL